MVIADNADNLTIHNYMSDKSIFDNVVYDPERDVYSLEFNGREHYNRFLWVMRKLMEKADAYDRAQAGNAQASRAQAENNTNTDNV